MKCMILAAGYATRLYPLTENFPKPLLPVGGKAILDWLVEDLSGSAEEFIVISNHKFAEHFRRWAFGRNGNITVLDDGTSTNETRLGAVRDILFAMEQKECGDEILVMAGDNLLDFSLREFVAYAREKGTSCVMCHEEKDLLKQQRTAIVTFNREGLITSYEEKPGEPKGHYAVPPFYFYLQEDLRRIPEALESGCGADAPGSFAAWLSRRAPMHAWVMPGKRYDIGGLESYKKVKEIFDCMPAKQMLAEMEDKRV